MVRLKELEEDKLAAQSNLSLKDVYELFESTAYGTEVTKYEKLMVKVEEVRDQVNKGNWDLLKHQTDKLVLIKAFL